MNNIFKRKPRISKRLDTREKVIDFLLSPESKEFRIYFLKRLYKYFSKYNDLFLLGFYQNMFYNHGFMIKNDEIIKVFKLDWEEAKKDFQANGWAHTEWWTNNNYQKLMYIEHLITKQ